VEKQALIVLAQQKAEKYGLDAALVCSVIEQESNWNPFAVRYEPAFYARYIVPSIEVGHFGHTEATCRATSWGLMQVMGQTARDSGFGGPFLSELCDPEVGIEIGCKYLSVLYSKTGNNMRDALLRYNGGSNEDYPDQVIARMPTYGREIQG
jgi:soluble lytic murein transglycosylase-like protein